MIPEVIDAIRNRHTINLYDASRTLPDETIRELVDLATRAPSAFNLQNWRFLAVRSADGKARLRAAAFNQAKVSDAAVTFIMVGQLASHEAVPSRLAGSVAAGFMPEQVAAGWEGAAQGLYFEKPQTQRDEAVRSATLGANTLMFAAQAYGLGASGLIGFDPAAVAAAFDLAADEIPVLLVTVGYIAEGNWPQKPRRPIDEVLTLA
jgi:nitroreductase